MDREAAPVRDDATLILDDADGCSARSLPVTTKTTCPYCGVGCGVLAEVAPDGQVSVRGDPEHPANFGRLCSKGSALAETLSLDDRLLHPEIDGRRASWNEALNLVADRFSAAIAEHGPDAVAFYVSGQLLTEDYYVANKLMKGFIGSANIDTNSRLCMSSSVAGHKRAFGTDTVPGSYEDLDEADLVVLVGSNFAWCHPVLFQRLLAAREARGTTIVVIDPRRTATAELADLHLAIAPDGDVALFNGLLRHLSETAADRAFVEQHTSGFAAALEVASACNVETVASATGLSLPELARFFDLFASTDRTVTVYSQGVNQSVCGTDKVNSIINCHLLTGRIGRPGMGPFSITGQPNAMGGREVGGLANQLAAHLELDDPTHRDIVADHWQAPRLATTAGLKAVDLFRAVAEGRIKALWIMATNPVDSLPEADGVRDALAACPFVVSSDVVRRTDTTAMAHVLLPALAWGEKDGTVTNSERRISRQRPFLGRPGEAMPDWWIVDEVAARMGFGSAFAYSGPAAIFREHAALSAVAPQLRRDFDIGGLATLADEGYDTFEPVQWPVRPVGDSPQRRFFGDGNFFTPDRRARFVPTHAPQPRAADPDFPLVLNTGRIRDQWHTMTRTGKSPRLSAHQPEPILGLHPADAEAASIVAGALVVCEGRHGQVVARAEVNDEQRRGSVFLPMHWSGQFSGAGRAGALVPSVTDPFSGQPASKMTDIRILPFDARWYGFAITRDRIADPAAPYWAAARVEHGWQWELAGKADPDDWRAHGLSLLRIPDDSSAFRIIAFHDRARGLHRLAVFADGELRAAIFFAPQPITLARAFLAASLGNEFNSREASRLLAGRPGAGRPDPGPTICSCFQIGLNQILAAITEGGCTTVAEVGAALRAGTNCGSCRPEIGRLLRSVA